MSLSLLLSVPIDRCLFPASVAVAIRVDKTKAVRKCRYVLDVGRRRIPSVFFMGFGPDPPGFKAAPFLRAVPRQWSGCAYAFDHRFLRPLRPPPLHPGNDPTTNQKD